MSRPIIEIEQHKLEALMRFKPTLEDCAAFFKCSPDTIERRIKEFTITEENPEGLTFAEFREQNMVHTRFGLVRKALSKADAGDNVMLIFCLKNLVGWRDKQPDENDIVVNNFVNDSEEVLDRKIEEKMKKLGGSSG